MEKVKYCKSCGAYIPYGFEKCVACGFSEKPPNISADRDSGAKDNYMQGDPVYVYVDGKRLLRQMQHWQRKDIHEQKEDIDLDSILQKQYINVKFGGESSQYYLGDATVDVVGICSGRTMDGRMQRISEKRKIKLTLIER